jgi:hypothetical protein
LSAWSRAPRGRSVGGERAPALLEASRDAHVVHDLHEVVPLAWPRAVVRIVRRPSLHSINWSSVGNTTRAVRMTAPPVAAVAGALALAGGQLAVATGLGAHPRQHCSPHPSRSESFAATKAPLEGSTDAISSVTATSPLTLFQALHRRHLAGALALLRLVAHGLEARAILVPRLRPPHAVTAATGRVASLAPLPPRARPPVSPAGRHGCAGPGRVTDGAAVPPPGPLGVLAGCAGWDKHKGAPGPLGVPARRAGWDKHKGAPGPLGVPAGRAGWGPCATSSPPAPCPRCCGGVRALRAARPGQQGNRTAPPRAALAGALALAGGQLAVAAGLAAPPPSAPQPAPLARRKFRCSESAAKNDSRAQIFTFFFFLFGVVVFFNYKITKGVSAVFVCRIF